MKSPLAITACSLLTPLDAPGISTWEAILQGKRIHATCAVHDLQLPPDNGLDRSIRIACAVAQRALSGVTLHPGTPLFCGTSKGPVGIMLDACERLRAGLPLTELQARQSALGVGAMGPIVAEHLHLCGPVHTSVAACASGLHAVHRAAEALWRGECQRALVVAADASLHPLFEASFARLGVLAPLDANGIRRCQPFGEKGEGFFVTEAGAAIVLERPTPQAQPPQPVLAWLEESWIGADSTALIAIDPKTHSLRSGLQSCAANASLAFIHAHATGTAHDQFELDALRTLFPNNPPIFSSKKYLGHSLGAAGLVSLALSILSHHHAATPIGIPVPPDASSLTLAQGFGGHIAISRLRSN